ncbi:sulfatase [Actinomadura scrupuli]|uniref:sulfatase n=1 Tax=Actinomadura scrupuli TaxID=559629 RepID=UPI003D97F820
MTHLRRLPAQGEATAEDGPATEGRLESMPGDDAAGADATAGTVATDDAPGAGDRRDTEESPGDEDGASDAAGDTRRRRPVLAWLTTALACLLVLFALLAPEKVGLLKPGAFVRIPVEGLLGVALLLVLPVRARRVVAALLGAGLGVLVIVKILDMGFFEALARPFDPMLDWAFVGAGVEFLTTSVGRAGAIGTVVAVVVLVVAVLVLMTLSVLRLTRLVARHDTVATRSVAVLGIVWLVSAVLGVQIVPGVPVASKSAGALAYRHVRQVGEDLNDREAFAAQAAVDAFRDTPGKDLLTGLRGKDVVLAFVESYGRDAVEDPEYASQVGAVLDDGTRRLRAAGFASRSAFLTSPTSGGGSWLAHATLLSGLWINNQQRYRSLVASDRLTLNGAFRRASWRSVAVMPGNTRAWPEGGFFGYDKIYDGRNLGYRGVPFNWGTPPDQYTLSAFQRLERATPGHAPVMAEMPLVTSHSPWTPTPRQLVDWHGVGDGSVFDLQSRVGAAPRTVWRNAWRDPTRVRAAYRRTIEYSLNSLISYVETYGDDDLVLVFLGDHQAAPLVVGANADRDVPITIVAHDKTVLDRISGWGWQDGLKPAPRAPVWRMDTFRDRFLTAFGPQGPHAP